MAGFSWVSNLCGVLTILVYFINYETLDTSEIRILHRKERYLKCKMTIWRNRTREKKTNNYSIQQVQW